ncbi:hypothetical protein [Bacillus sp. AFS088145]|uniref:hypothetical protein n=1 Tax=Bacillus sp. AFS088145 TaxID=2033514 RepID=UPI000BFA27C3|nr:hypothetical protein [Bacillus sp. AFS088145]PFH84799.1 hypothetical protein COI44_15955 [Bacillus sp. AFS088145]
MVKMYIREGHLHKGDHVRVGFTNYDAVNGADIHVELRNKDDKLIDIQDTGLGDYKNDTLVFKELKEPGEYHLDIGIQMDLLNARWAGKEYQQFRYDGIIVD